MYVHGFNLLSLKHQKLLFRVNNVGCLSLINPADEARRAGCVQDRRRPESARVTPHLGHIADVMCLLPCSACQWVGLTRPALQSLQLFLLSVENGLNCFMCKQSDCLKLETERRIQPTVRRSNIPWHQLMCNDVVVCILVRGKEAMDMNPLESSIGFVNIEDDCALWKNLLCSCSV